MDLPLNNTWERAGVYVAGCSPNRIHALQVARLTAHGHMNFIGHSSRVGEVAGPAGNRLLPAVPVCSSVRMALEAGHGSMGGRCQRSITQTTGHQAGNRDSLGSILPVYSSSPMAIGTQIGKDPLLVDSID